MVAEVVRLLGYTNNARILTNPATEILRGVALRDFGFGATFGMFVERCRFDRRILSPVGVNDHQQSWWLEEDA